jgi:hypothetical protein
VKEFTRVFVRSGRHWPDPALVQRFDTLTPAVFFGKGFGDLPDSPSA